MPDDFIYHGMRAWPQSVASPGGDWEQHPPPVVSKSNFEIFLDLLRKLRGGGGGDVALTND